jgi:hypothetical protein
MSPFVDDVLVKKILRYNTSEKKNIETNSDCVEKIMYYRAQRHNSNFHYFFYEM